MITENDTILEHQASSHPIPEHQGFTTQDILWAVGIWTVMLSLSPVVIFYVMMVA